MPKTSPRPKKFVAETALVRDCRLGPGVKVWHFTNLYGCSVGARTQIGSYCEIKKGARVGTDCRFQSFVFVPEGTVIGDSVFVGPRVTFINDKYPSARKAASGKWKCSGAAVGKGAVLGAGAVIGAGVRIGRGAVVGAGACVTRDVAPYAVVAGNPARVIGSVRDPRYREEFEDWTE